MSNAKVVMGQAANTLVKPLEVEDVFSTYLYTGNGSTQTITNGIDLAGEGGLVWIKNRGDTTSHALFDTERGATKQLDSSVFTAEETQNGGLTAFNADGFSVANNGNVNADGFDIASWTFRKAPKFFDVVTWTGDGASDRQIAHNLGITPGCIFVKSTNAVRSWSVFHTGLGPTQDIALNLTNAAFTNSTSWNDTSPTDTEFTVGSYGNVNTSGNTYVAYLFAHNDGDGGFNGGDIIKCGSYTGNGTYLGGPEIDLGFEPQWLLIKSTGNESWRIADNMRGIAMGTAGAYLSANLDNLEAPSFGVELQPTGFKVMSNNADLNSNGQDYIYIAIRRGTKVPESATEVFDVDGSTRSSDGSSPRHRADFPVDMAFYKDRAGGASYISDRLRQSYLDTSSTSNEFSSVAFDFQNGWIDSSTVVSANVSWMWKRAPGFFDVVAYTGDGVGGRTVSHNLGVAPEMMIVKKRNSSTNSSWIVYHSGNTAPNTTNAASNFLVLNSTQASLASLAHFNQTMPSSTEFTLGTSTITNNSGDTFIAYLFASLPGISKVGSYTGTGAQQVIDCGFTTGARFVFIKKSSASGDWGVYDTARGIVAGNDNILELNTTDEQVISDVIDPDPSGFAVTGTNTFRTNDSGETYIFYAIA